MVPPVVVPPVVVPPPVVGGGGVVVGAGFGFLKIKYQTKPAIKSKPPIR